MQFFNRSENSANTTISYYDKGAALGLLLDLKIRHETENRMSLDDVMRTLYRKYHDEKKRGFTDAEFRLECESAAGCPLPEIFDIYARTVQEIDYPKYFAYAGLEIDVNPREEPGVFFGATTREHEGRLTIAIVEWDSPACHGGLSARDEILTVDGLKATAKSLEEILDSKKPGDKLKVSILRRGRSQDFEILLKQRLERSFKIQPLSRPDPLQSKILEDWMRNQ
jgi:predicted metalloprotease with PDZ domain